MQMRPAKFVGILAESITHADNKNTNKTQKVTRSEFQQRRRKKLEDKA